MLKSLSNSARDDIARYIREAQEFPMLDAETEWRLARQFRDHGDKEAAKELANSYLRLVVKIARGYLGYNQPLADLISEGNVGLMQAIERFDPEQGYRLSTYAQWWIRATIREFVMRSESLVRMGTTAAQKKLFFNLRRLKAAHRELEDGELSPLTVAAIARRLDVDEAEVVEMNRRMVGGTYSLNAPANDDSDMVFMDMLVDPGEDMESRYAATEEMDQRRRQMGAAMTVLTERERHILSERRLSDEPPTLETLAKIYGISRERVRQIEVQAFEKLRKAMMRAVQKAANNPALAA